MRIIACLVVALSGGSIAGVGCSDPKLPEKFDAASEGACQDLSDDWRESVRSVSVECVTDLDCETVSSPHACNCTTVVGNPRGVNREAYRGSPASMLEERFRQWRCRWPKLCDAGSPPAHCISGQCYVDPMYSCLNFLDDCDWRLDEWAEVIGGVTTVCATDIDCVVAGAGSCEPGPAISGGCGVSVNATELQLTGLLYREAAFLRQCDAPVVAGCPPEAAICVDQRCTTDASARCP